MLGAWEIIVIFLVVLLLFGGKRLPGLAKSLGTGIREFKKASQEISDEIDRPISPQKNKQAEDSEEAETVIVPISEKTSRNEQ
ncbi:Sec-independent protein translocase protein TatA [Chlamydiales bacterium SCGC AG-110-M15]|nr:Sec-independent protein translocase protein TatA [Chlamydiales bacterium SCGC AG-110-M15]